MRPSHTGTVSVLFDIKKSFRFVPARAAAHSPRCSGAIQCVGKAERKADPNDFGAMPHIYTRLVV